MCAGDVGCRVPAAVRHTTEHEQQAFSLIARTDDLPRVIASFPTVLPSLSPGTAMEHAGGYTGSIRIAPWVVPRMRSRVSSDFKHHDSLTSGTSAKNFIWSLGLRLPDPFLAPPNFHRARLAAAAERSPNVVVAMLHHAAAYLYLPRVQPPGVHETSPAKEECETSRDANFDAAAAQKSAWPMSLSERIDVLLEWNTDSLSILMDIHKDMAAVLLCSARMPGTPGKADDTASRTVDDPDACTTKLCEQAVESLTVALAAAGVRQVPYLSARSNPSVEVGKKVAEGGPPPAEAAVHPQFDDGDGDTVDGTIPANACDRSSPLLSWSTHPAEVHGQQGTGLSNDSHRAGRGIDDTSTFDRRKGLSHIATTARVVAVASPERIAELHAMRCSARERLGLVEAALGDVQDALIAKPRTPKLLAKAASLALRARIDSEQNGGMRDCATVRRGGAEVLKGAEFVRGIYCVDLEVSWF